MPNAVFARPWKRRAMPMARGNDSWSEKTQRLGARVDAVPAGNGAISLLAPVEGVAGVVARAVEELAEVHVEVAQEGSTP